MLRRTAFISMAMATLALATPLAAQTLRPKGDTSVVSAPKLKPQPKPLGTRSCEEYGAGFVRVEGSNTCVKVGGAVSIGGGWTR